MTAFDRQKAELLLRSKLPCLGCHELNGAGGRIGPRLTDVTARRSPQHIYEMIRDPQGTMPGIIMPRVPMPEATRVLIASYLILNSQSHLPSRALPMDTIPAHQHSTPAPVTGSDEAPSLYGRFCAACHGANGGGDGPNARYLPVKPAAHSSPAKMSARSDDALFDTIFAGGYVMNRSNVMPPFGMTLSRGQIWALVRYIRTLCHCQGPSWSRGNS